MIKASLIFQSTFAVKKCIMENRSKEEVLLANGKISYLFRKFGIPGIVGLLFIGLQPIVDGLFLGNFMGAEAMAGINLFTPIYTFMSASAVVAGIGCQTIVSISLGEQKYQRANNAFRTAFIFLTIYSIAIAAVSNIWAKELSFLLGADEVLYPYATEYIRAFSPFFLFLTLVFLGDYILKATGRPYSALSLLGLILLGNITLDYLFIVEFGMGVKGAALATGISLALSCILMFAKLLKRKNIVKLQEGKFSTRLLGEMLYNGSSSGVSELSAGITVLLFNWIMMKNLGADGVAALTAVNYLLYLGVQLFVGLSDGIIPIISYNYGAGNTQRIRETLRLGLKSNAIIGCVFFTLIFFGGEFFIHLFFNENGEGNINHILEIARTGSKITAFAFFLNGANILSSSFFTSRGDALTSAIISFLRGLLLIVIGIAICPLLLGNNGIWLTIPLAELITAFYCWFAFKKNVSWQQQTAI